MLRTRWLFIGAALALQAGCVAQLPPCHDPGTAFSKSCYYRLTVTEIDTNKGLVTGKVDEEAVKENATRHFWNSESMPWPMGPDYDLKDYEYAKYRFEVEGGANTVVTGQNYHFCSVPHRWALRTVAIPKDSDKDPCP